MKAIFYDRKNKREVSNEELKDINLVRTTLSIDSEEFSSGEWNQQMHKAYLIEEKISEFGYKSEKCESWQNWDLHTSTFHLVFLRLE